MNGRALMLPRCYDVQVLDCPDVYCLRLVLSVFETPTFILAGVLSVGRAHAAETMHKQAAQSECSEQC